MTGDDVAKALTILRDGVAVGACRFAAENLPAFTEFLDSLRDPTGNGPAVAARPDDQTCKRLLELFVAEVGSETIGDALILAALNQPPADGTP